MSQNQQRWGDDPKMLDMQRQTHMTCMLKHAHPLRSITVVNRAEESLHLRFKFSYPSHTDIPKEFHFMQNRARAEGWLPWKRPPNLSMARVQALVGS